ncbi:SsrA-binding protein SmpB [Candidatus Tachikawaea gelatinosa]|uniref:SsrA-binding protein n=1 Tax=Candidatus Tachikawaea gelatinosa TaxID=1410383 RepID=A0A090AQ66_9ENTR|nr:SsrA-binding protein SmpB [Candidatus Tachikawaea gelatinosa]BAP58487.1 ssrA-binding protein [Candidatus Tachikawaea gelatinosa]
MSKQNNSIILYNKKVQYDYFIEKKFEAGIVLNGWEIKSIRAGKVNITNSYVFLHNAQAYIVGMTIKPLICSSNKILEDSQRNKKLLFHKHEISSIYGYVNRKKYTLVATSLYWKKAWCKIEIGLAKGKKTIDKRENIKNREWKISQSRILSKKILD